MTHLSSGQARWPRALGSLARSTTALWGAARSAIRRWESRHLISISAQPADLALGDAAGLAPRPSPPPRLYGPDPGRRGRSRPCAARGWRSSTVRGARLKGAVAIAVALVWRALSPGSSQSRPLDFPLHQTLGGKADPLAQRIAVACL